MKKLLIMGLLCSMCLTTLAEEKKQSYIVTDDFKPYKLNNQVNAKINALKKKGYEILDFEVSAVNKNKNNPFYYKLVITYDDNK